MYTQLCPHLHRFSESNMGRDAYVAQVSYESDVSSGQNLRVLGFPLTGESVCPSPPGPPPCSCSFSLKWVDKTFKNF